MQNIYILFMHFFIYSVIGWLLEVIYCKIIDGKFYNRGFLNGPYCPIYGFGAISIILLLQRFEYNPILIFVFGLLLTSILEYITSFLMEKIFNAKWWDYSKEKFNIYGRVCLKNSIMFGLLALILIYGLNPLITKFVDLFNVDYLYKIVNLIFVLMVIDCSVTVMEIINLKEKLMDLKEFTETIIKEKNIFNENSDAAKKLDEFKEKLISKKDILNNHLLKAFPNLTFKENHIEFLKIKELIKEKKEKIKITNKIKQK